MRIVRGGRTIAISQNPTSSTFTARCDCGISRTWSFELIRSDDANVIERWINRHLIERHGHGSDFMKNGQVARGMGVEPEPPKTKDLIVMLNGEDLA